MGKETISIILYYASWCGYCKEIAPLFKSIIDKTYDDKTKDAIENKEKELGVKLEFEMHEDSDISEETKQTFQGFPTIVIKKCESITTYKGDRTIPAILDSLNFSLKRNKGNKVGGSSDIYKYKYYKYKLKYQQLKGQ